MLHNAAATGAEASTPAPVETQQPDVLQSAQRYFDSTLQWQREAQEALTAAEKRLSLAEAKAKQLLEQYNMLCQNEEHLARKQWNFVNAVGQEQGPHSLAELLHFVRGAKSLPPHVMIHNYTYGMSLPFSHHLGSFPVFSKAWDAQEAAAKDHLDAQQAVTAAQAQAEQKKQVHEAAAATLEVTKLAQARWLWTADDGASRLELTPAELEQHMAQGYLEAEAALYPVSSAGVPRAAEEVVVEWKAALTAASAKAHRSAGSSAAVPVVGPALPAFTEAELVWCWWDDGQQQGPYRLCDLRGWVESGHLYGDMLVFHSDTPDIQQRLDTILALPIQDPAAIVHTAGTASTALVAQQAQHAAFAQQQKAAALIPDSVDVAAIAKRVREELVKAATRDIKRYAQQAQQAGRGRRRQQP
ncbi:hypothetical protein WJX72_012285 [[Myrmecia] bisecta]|uniref:GYF domain-containing protein n=1 Tax=[Myrmecia] bisecta TaxID=41462 RepID=A0AAW1PF11_9CHLO